MLQLDQVTFQYAPAKPLFEGFNWQVERGQTWTVLGASGCGKTTLLYLLAGLLFTSAGSIRVEGELLQRPRPQTGLVLQDYGLLPWATVEQNVALGLRIRQFYGPDGRHAPAQLPSAPDIADWLERLGLHGLEKQYPSQLSGGQRQRTAIARTLVLQPDLLLMDEPFSSLDALTRQDLQEAAIKLWQEQHFTLIAITHAIEEAIRLGQHILVLGRPPHTAAQRVDNPLFGQGEERDPAAYAALARQLRSMMEGKA